MQGSADQVGFNNQDLTVNQLPLRTKVANEVLLQPPQPSCIQYSQQSSSNIFRTMLEQESENHGQTLPDQPKNTLVALNRNLLEQSEVLTTVTPKLRATLIVFGVGFLFCGAAAIVLEMTVIMYSFSIYYRGLWAGSSLIGTGISIIVAAGRTSYSFLFMKYLLRCNLLITAFGAVLSVLEMTITYQCEDETSLSLCDSTIGRTLKITVIAELYTAALYNLFILSYAMNMLAKSVSEPPPTNTPNP